LKKTSPKKYEKLYMAKLGGKTRVHGHNLPNAAKKSLWSGQSNTPSYGGVYVFKIYGDLEKMLRNELKLRKEIKI
jgi:hypothetical protein